MRKIGDLKKVLEKRAEGYTRREVTEEFTFSKEAGELILTKRKVSKKHVPPDVTALKLLLTERGENEFDAYTDGELSEMKRQLIESLQDVEDEECGHDE